MRMLTRLGCIALLVTAVVACKSAPVMGSAHAQGELIPLSITTPKAIHRFQIEIARTESEQARGLMFRESLPANGGMIFPMKPPRIASFWMKNTVISLDMIFIRADGTIARITPNTIPYSLEPVDSGEPIAAVLELAGGKAAALGIVEGDKVIWNDK